MRRRVTIRSNLENLVASTAVTVFCNSEPDKIKQQFGNLSISEPSVTLDVVALQPDHFSKSHHQCGNFRRIHFTAVKTQPASRAARQDPAKAESASDTNYCSSKLELHLLVYSDVTLSAPCMLIVDRFVILQRASPDCSRDKAFKAVRGFTFFGSSCYIDAALEPFF